MPAVVRSPTVADADAIAAVHVRAWQHAYRGMMPDEYLDGIDIDARAELWRRTLSASSTTGESLVIEEDGRIVGCSSFGPCRDEPDAPDAPPLAELFAINLDPDVWGRGLGQQLLESAVAGMRRLGREEAVLWVIPENARARRFYEAAGWEADGGQRVVEIQGVTVPEVRYRFALTRDPRSRLNGPP